MGSSVLVAFMCLVILTSHLGVRILIICSQSSGMSFGFACALACPGCLHVSAAVRGLPAYYICMSGNAYFEQKQERERVV